MWEACLTAQKYMLDNLVVIVDRNKLQITGKTEEVNPIEPLKEKFESFGFIVNSVNGNDNEELVKVFQSIPFSKDKPNLIIANTIKGFGVSFIENQIKWHHRVPTKEEYQKAIEELTNQMSSYDK